MQKELKQRYLGLVNLLEEPIRQVVPALWELPFVHDTGHMCSGHVITGTQKLTQNNLKNMFWYPHDARMEIFYSTEPEHIEQRDAFMFEIKNCKATLDSRVLQFETLFDLRITPHRFGQTKNVLNAFYSADIHETQQNTTNKTIEYIIQTEDLFTQLWQEIAGVIRKYALINNPHARKAEVEGNYRKTINWDYWQQQILGIKPYFQK